MKLQDALIDNRSDKLKAKDFDHREIASSPIVEYTTRAKALKIAKTYELEDQFGTLSCAAHSGARCLAIHEVIEGRKYQRLSPAFIYRQRVNYGSEGMFVYDLGDIAKEKGACLFNTLPTPKTEALINGLKIDADMKKEALPFRGGNYIAVNDKSIESYANISNNLKLPCTLFVWGSVAEWSKETPEVLDEKLTLEKAYVRHLVTILPNTAHTYKKKKYLIIIDSSTFGGRHLRYISEDFIKRRTVMGQYWLNLITEKDVDLPVYTFDKDLKYGDENNDVFALQTVLQSLAYFPVNIKPTGFFGGITLKAVKDFQKKYEFDILISIGLKEPTGFVGKKTREKLNSLTG
jgi:hypothetical protein